MEKKKTVKQTPEKIKEKELSIHDKLVKIQSELRVPKNNYNKFSNFYYRSAEDVQEALKPLLAENGLTLLLSDEVVLIGARYYIKATASLTDGKETVATEAYAREEEVKKGMDGSQISGSSSSYSRKYALNGMFLIDDTKDADTRDNKEEVKEEKTILGKIGDDVLASRLRIKIKNVILKEDLEKLKPEITEAGKVLTKEQFVSVIDEAKKKKESLKSVEISDEELMNLDFNE
jgi:hypothetical protein